MARKSNVDMIVTLLANRFPKTDDGKRAAQDFADKANQRDGNLRHVVATTKDASTYVIGVYNLRTINSATHQALFIKGADVQAQEIARRSAGLRPVSDAAMLKAAFTRAGVSLADVAKLPPEALNKLLADIAQAHKAEDMLDDSNNVESNKA